MSISLLTKASGHANLDQVFASYVNGASPPPTGLLDDSGVDIATRYAPIIYGTQAAATGLLTQQAGHADINTLFAAIGTTDDVMANPGYSKLVAETYAPPDSLIYTATTAIVLNSNGTWNEASTQTPNSGIWYQGAPITGVGNNFQVFYTVAVDSSAGVTITNGATSFTSLANNTSCTIALKYKAIAIGSRIVTGAVQIQIANLSGTVLSNQTVDLNLAVFIN